LLVLMSIPFELSGSLLARPLRKAVSARTRPLEGFLTTYGVLSENGGIIPTADRDGQVMEAASALGLIDFQEYLRTGLWNDTHDDTVIVGRSDGLEFHNGSTKLSQAHRKVGYFTAGHLFDPANPASFGDYKPSPKELERSDYFWDLASSTLGETDRGLAFSAHGRMWTDPTNTRILTAKIDQVAVCETPVNPYCPAEIPEVSAELAKAVKKPTASSLLASLKPETREKLVAIIKKRFPHLSDAEIDTVLLKLAENHHYGVKSDAQ